MDLRTIADLLWFRVWWSYHRRGQVDWVEVPYHAFNLLEGTAWLVLAGLVLRRYLRHRRSPVAGRLRPGLRHLRLDRLH